MIWALLACTTVQDTPDEPPETTDTEVPEDTVSTGMDTVEEYLEHYCSEYAVRCGIYADVQTCWDEYWDWMSTCQVNSVDDLQTCSTWLADLSCDYQGWTDACDNAFVCD